MTAANGSADKPEPRRKLTLILGWICLSLGIITLGMRIWLVHTGVLYGTSPLHQVDATVGALIVIGVALIIWWKTSGKGNVRKAKAKNATENGGSSGQGWANWASGATALVAFGALVVSLLNLVEPLNPPNLAMPDCPGARDKNVPYVGITAGVEGDNSRQGPALSYLPNGRFPQGCSIGFSVYCLGDSISEAGGTTAETWVTSRWLLVAKQSHGLGSTVAHILSGENSAPQFISDAFITPETSYDKLPLGTPRQCRGTFPYPGKTGLQRFNSITNTLTAAAPHATNMGFAVWLPPRQGFQDSDTYLQLPSLSSSPIDNPGETAADGSKTVKWDYKGTLVPQLIPSPGTGRSATGHVVIMAIPCLAVNIPARTDTAATAVYQLSKTGPPVLSKGFPKGLDIHRLARAACEAGS